MTGWMTGGRVPGNSWDLLDGRAPDPLPRVSVVVAHYEQPAELARTLLALARQDYPADLLEVIVADDGSAVAPRVPEGVALVRQDDLGFRLSAVRNLGARAATGEVLCFLDADTVPEPGYVRALTRLPALLPEAVTVGRRRHADLRGEPADAPIEEAGPATALPEPEWLADAYRRSGDLLRCDDRSYRYVIGAVIACTRALFDELGGFDESFTAYGGEDWEWAHRAWQAGAVFAHVPAAVAWHDGPDWAGRPDAASRAAANRQTLRLATAIPVAGSRGAGLLPVQPDLLVHLRGAPTDAAAFVCVDALLAAAPTATILVDRLPDVPALRDDPRVHDLSGGGAAPCDARVTLTLPRPLLLPWDRLRERVAALGTDDEGSLELLSPDGALLGVAVSRRARARRDRWGDDSGFRTGRLILDEALLLRDDPDVEAYVGGWAGPDRLR